MEEVIIYTDGGKRGSSGIGAFSHVTFYPDKEELESYASVIVENETRKVTNQTMELTAVIHAIDSVKQEYKENCTVIIHSDSAYVVNCFKDEWWKKWERNGWENTKQQPIANQQLWKYLVNQYKEYDIDFVKVRGHSGDKYNEMCDDLLNEAMDEWEKENVK